MTLADESIEDSEIHWIIQSLDSNFHLLFANPTNSFWSCHKWQTVWLLDLLDLVRFVRDLFVRDLGKQLKQRKHRYRVGTSDRLRFPTVWWSLVIGSLNSLASQQSLTTSHPEIEEHTEKEKTSSRASWGSEWLTRSSHVALENLWNVNSAAL